MANERLQKLIAEAGLSSRRHAEEMITAGEVTVNGEVVTTLGTRADPKVDHIKVRGRLINPLLEDRKKIYVLLNKPRGYLTSVADPQQRPLVTELVPATFGRLHPVGRLDFNTEGLLILTNDGELTNHITAARNKVPKVYEVKVKGKPPENAIERLRRGIALEDEDGHKVRTAPAEITPVDESESNTWYEVILHEGRNQQIRRMFDAIGHSVVKLRRVSIGNVKDEDLKVGMYRLLDPGEVRKLMQPATRRTSKPHATSDKGSSAKKDTTHKGTTHKGTTQKDLTKKAGTAPRRNAPASGERSRSANPSTKQGRGGQQSRRRGAAPSPRKSRG